MNAAATGSVAAWLAAASAILTLCAARPTRSRVPTPHGRVADVLPQGGAPANHASGSPGQEAVRPFADPPRRPSLAGRLSVPSHRVRARQRRAFEAEVPQLLDLLAAGSSAGLSAPLALRQAGEALRGPLSTELRRAFRAVDLGSRWRDELASLAERTGSIDLRRTVTVLARTEALGASLAEATRELAVSVRASRRAAVTERARTAPVKMLFPLVFLILPAFLLLTVVPVLITTVRSIQ